ncbi:MULTISPECIES: LysR family transcriptional regulator [unclassified Bradyrhizobium]|uniref:LysR family transcriptional regulator n=1 Tax=unclassified Bradyrhizobium TaxID=2631580 RepID=UPI002FEFF719
MEWAGRIGRRLKLRDLHLLITVVQLGSMAKAAAELGVSQPAVSKGIADMEQTLGLRLLDRGRNGIEPTAYGRALVKRGLIVFDELKQGVEELEFLADPSVGSLRIGSTESIAAGMLPAIIERFWRDYPGVHLDVAQTVISTLHYRELRERSIDLLIGRIPTPFTDDDLEADVVYDDEVVVVAGRQSKWARARNVKLADLSGEPWILPPSDTMPGSLAVELFRAGGAEMPRAPVTTLSMHLCCRLVASGRFVATLPISILRFGGHDQALQRLPINLPKQPRPVGIVTLKNRTPSPVAKLFIACVHRVLARIPKA